MRQNLTKNTHTFYAVWRKSDGLCDTTTKSQADNGLHVLLSYQQQLVAFIQKNSRFLHSGMEFAKLMLICIIRFGLNPIQVIVHMVLRVQACMGLFERRLFMQIS